MSAANGAARETRVSLAMVFRNPGLRRVNLALAGSLIGDWAYATAVDRVGVRRRGRHGSRRLGRRPAAADGGQRRSRRCWPTGYPRKLGDDRLRPGPRSCSSGAAAIVVQADGPAAVVFVLATLSPHLRHAVPPRPDGTAPLARGEPAGADGRERRGPAPWRASRSSWPGVGGAAAHRRRRAIVFAAQRADVPVSATIVVGHPALSTGRAPVPVTPAGERRRHRRRGARARPRRRTSTSGATPSTGFRTIWRNPDLRLVATTTARRPSSPARWSCSWWPSPST